jgi:hypothetical protein
MQGNFLWDWNSLDSVRDAHSALEGWALVFFALLVVFDVLAHLADEHPTREKKLERIGLWCFGVAIVAEIVAYPYGKRNDILAEQRDNAQRGKLSVLDNSTQRLKTEAQHSKERSDALEVGLEMERQKTARFQKEADVARLALSNQVTSQAPRWRLLEANESLFVESLKPFAGQRVKVMMCGMAPTIEVQTLWSDMFNMLRPDGYDRTKSGAIKDGAGWDVDGTSGVWEQCAQRDLAAGIMLFVSSTADAKVMDAANAMTTVLNKISALAYMERVYPEQTNFDNAIAKLGSPRIMAQSDNQTIFVLIETNPLSN